MNISKEEAKTILSLIDIAWGEGAYGTHHKDLAKKIKGDFSDIEMGEYLFWERETEGNYNMRSNAR